MNDALLCTGNAEGVKAWRHGTHRVRDPEATLARVLPHARAMGITRIAGLTGLDVLGMPVVAAVRPNSRSLAVHQGKGLTPAAAKASAVMEAAECFHAEAIGHPLRLARPDEMGAAGLPAVDPRRLPRARGGADPMAERFLWIEGRDLATGGPRWVPYELVHTDYTVAGSHAGGAGLFQATTNGLAAGNHPLEAVMHALCEVVERDAVALWRAAGGPAARGVGDALLDPASVRDPACRDLLRRFADAETAVRLWDLTTDVGLPVFLCLAVPEGDGRGGIEPELGSGCHPAPEVALARALCEAAQARVTRISGARDDFTPESYGEAARAARLAEARRWLAAAERGPRRDFAAVADRSGPTLRHDLDVALAGLARAGCDQVVWVDLTRPALGIPAGRIVVPGLEGPFLPEGEYAPGARAARAAGEGGGA